MTSPTTDENSLKVSYTRGGRYYALHWWTYNERGHLVLAPTEAKVREIAARIFDEHIGVELKAYCEIEIVGPSKLLRVLATEHNTRKQVETFYHEVLRRLRDAVEAGYALAAPFAKCAEYKFQDDESATEAEGESEGTRDFRLRFHSGCASCTEGVRLIGMTTYELFLTYYQRWEDSKPQGRRRGQQYKTKGVPIAGISHATEAVDGESLWYAYSNFGHHSGGLELHEIKYDDLNGPYSHPCIGSGVIFYFRRLREIDVSELTAMRDASDEGWKLRRAQEEQARIKKRKREELEEIESVLAFFAAKE